MGIRRVWGLLGALSIGLAVLAGPGIQQTLTLSPEGFTSLELSLFWTGDPVSASLGGQWESTGFVRGEIGGSFRAEVFGLQAGFGVEATGMWEVMVGGEFLQPPISLLGNISFGATGVVGWSVGALLELEAAILQGVVVWEGNLKSSVAVHFTLGSLSLEAGVSLSDGNFSLARGGVELVGDLGAVGFEASYWPLTQELFLSTEFDLRSEHISLGFVAVWNPFPGGETQPSAVHPQGPAPEGFLRYLHELRLEASVATPTREGKGPEEERGEPSALITAPKASDFIVGEEIVFRARGSRVPEGPPREFLWDFGDGHRARGVEARHSYDLPGVYRVVLVVGYGGGSVARAERVLRILPPELLVDFTWEPDDPTILDDVRFIDLSQGEIVSWHWDFGDGNVSAEREPRHRYSQKGVFQVTLTVTDKYGHVASATKTLTVVNIPPVADPGGPYEGVVYQEIIFSAKGSHDPDGEIVEYFWDFGDGAVAKGETVAHAYLKPGTYEVCLTVVDDDGAEARDCTEAEVVYYPQIGGEP